MVIHSVVSEILGVVVPPPTQGTTTPSPQMPLSCQKEQIPLAVGAAGPEAKEIHRFTYTEKENKESLQCGFEKL